MGHCVSLADLLNEVAEALEPLAAEVDDLTVYPYWADEPSPPALDVYPGTPFQAGAGFGAGNNQVFLTVRARVAMADPGAAQATLVRLLDPDDPASVEVALSAVDGMAIAEGGVSGFTVYADDAPVQERLLGCEWRVTTFL